MINLIYTPCSICKPTGGKYIYTEIDGEEYAEKCKCYSDYLHKKALYINLRNAGLNADFIFDYKLSDYVGKDEIGIKDKVNKYIDKFDDKYNNISLYFYSKSNGTQKTTIASYIGKELIRQGKSVNLILMHSLLDLLKDNFNRSEEEENNYKLWYDKMLNCDLLIIDDSFDTKTLIYKSGYQIPFLDRFLRTRLEQNNKATIFTSNVTVSEIDEDKFTISIKELIKRNVVNSEFEFKDKIDRLRNDFNPAELWD